MVKMPSRDGDDDELEDSDCIPRLLEDVQSVHVVSSYFVHANLPRRLFEGGVYFTQRLQLCGVYSMAVSFRGRRLFAEIWYLLAAWYEYLLAGMILAPEYNMPT